MKRKISLMLALFLLLSLCACGGEREEMPNEGLNIVTTVFPAYDFARAVAGNRANVTLLLPPGSEVHSFEPTPQDILRIQSCDLLVCNGGESEEWMEEILEGTESELNIVTMLDCVSALEEEAKEGMQIHEEEHEEGEEGPEYDEHVWTSPVNAALISREICVSLCELDAAHADEYTANCESYCAKLNELDAAFCEVVANGKQSMLVFADRFPVRYFVEEYGLDYYAAFLGCADDAEPSAKTVAFLIDRVRENSIPAVMYIEFSNQKMADVVCEDTGCKKLLFNSCHNVSAEQFASGVTYLELMWANVDSVREALG